MQHFASRAVDDHDTRVLDATLPVQHAQQVGLALEVAEPIRHVQHGGAVWSF
jgi:hypothetical protein